MATKTRKEIIDETAAFYNIGNRAYDTDLRRCRYLTRDGKKCAAGRCMIDPKTTWGFGVSALFGDNETLDRKLLPEYRGHSIALWANIQDMHDIKSNWTDAGLSRVGEANVAKLHAMWDEPILQT